MHVIDNAFNFGHYNYRQIIKITLEYWKKFWFPENSEFSRNAIYTKMLTSLKMTNTQNFIKAYDSLKCK